MKRSRQNKERRDQSANEKKAVNERKRKEEKQGVNPCESSERPRSEFVPRIFV